MVLALSTSIMLAKTLRGDYNVWCAFFFADETGMRDSWILEWFFQTLLVFCSPGHLMSARLIVQSVNRELHFTHDKLGFTFREHRPKGSPWLSLFLISESVFIQQPTTILTLCTFCAPFSWNNTFQVSRFTSRNVFIPTSFSTTQYFVCSCTFYIS